MPRLVCIGRLLMASVPAATASGATFFIGGGAPCEQAQRIVSRSECEKAAEYLNMNLPNENVFIADNYPPGCHFASASTGHPFGEGIFWNQDHHGSWSNIGSIKAVCEQTSPPAEPDFSFLPTQKCDQEYGIESSSQCEQAAGYLRVRYDTLNAANRPKGCYAEVDHRFPDTGRYDVMYWNFVFPEDPPVGFGLAAVCEGGQPTMAPTAAPTAAPPTAAPTSAPTSPTAAPTAAPEGESLASSASVLFPASLWLGVLGLLWAAQMS